MIDDLTKLRVVHQISVPKDTINYALYSQNKNKLLLCNDTKILIYDTVNFTKESEINAHRRILNELSEMRNGNIISTSNDSSIKIWDLNNLRCINTINNVHENWTKKAQELNDGNILTCGGDTSMKLFDGNTFNQIKIFPDHYDNVNDFVVYNNGKFSSMDGTGALFEWNIQTGECNEDNIIGDVAAFCMLYDGGNNLITGGMYGNLILDINDWHTVKRIEKYEFGDSEVNSLCMLEDGNILGGLDDGSFFGLNDEFEIRDILGKAHNNAIIQIIKLNNGLIASVDGTNSIKIWRFNI